TRKAGYNFTYKEEDLRSANPVTLSVVQREVAEAIKELFAGQPLTYTINGKTITVKRKPAGSEIQQQTTVSGTVTDSVGAPLPGATVTVKGTDRQAITDNNGRFRIPAPTDSRLSFSLLGYEPVEMAAGTDNLHVVLRQVYAELTEVDVN